MKLDVDLVISQAEYELEWCNHFSDLPLSVWEFL